MEIYRIRGPKSFKLSYLEEGFGSYIKLLNGFKKS